MCAREREGVRDVVESNRDRDREKCGVCIRCVHMCARVCARMHVCVCVCGFLRERGGDPRQRDRCAP